MATFCSTVAAERTFGVGARRSSLQRLFINTTLDRDGKGDNSWPQTSSLPQKSTYDSWRPVEWVQWDRHIENFRSSDCQAYIELKSYSLIHHLYRLKSKSHLFPRICWVHGQLDEIWKAESLCDTDLFWLLSFPHRKFLPVFTQPRLTDSCPQFEPRDEWVIVRTSKTNLGNNLVFS